MCGRYTLTTDLFRIRTHYTAEPESPGLRDWKPRYNIAPTQFAPIILVEDGARKIRLARFGLIPHWARDEKIAYSTLNARADTAATKPAFRESFKSRRCLVPADGFFEWRPVGKKKQPYRIVSPDDRAPLFAFAGLWDRWKSPEGPVIDSFTIVTTEAGPDLAWLHDRMPVILPEDGKSQDLWLDPTRGATREMASLLKPLPAGSLRSYPVSTLVNSPRNDQIECIAPVEEEPDLFGRSH